MAAELGLFSLTQLQKLAQQQQQCQSVMWNYVNRRPTADDDDSWEVRAFKEDTGSAMGTTWPPRSYTCNFCRREFRSAQALGGHMNVHRRDRARLRQSPQGSEPSPSAVAVSSSPVVPMIFPSNDQFVAGGGLCLFYPIQNPGDSPSTLLSMAPYAQDVNFPAHVGESLLGKVGMVSDDSGGRSDDGGVVEELDLELRLGW